MSASEIFTCIAGLVMLACAAGYIVMGYRLEREKRAHQKMRHAAHDVIERTVEVSTFLYEMWALGYDDREALRLAKTVGQLGLTVEQLEQFVKQEREAWREATL